MRPSWILAGPVLWVLLTATSLRRGRACLAGGAACLVMLACLLPWGLRNHAVSGHFTFTTFWLGPSLYDGLNPQATGDSNMEFFDEEALLTRMTEYEVDQHYRTAAFDYARSHPRRVVELAGAKALRYWHPWPNAEQFRWWPLRLGVAAFFLPMMALAVWGNVVLLRGAPGTLTPGRERIWAVLILAGPILYFAALHLVFVSSLRYRLPAEYPLLVLTALGLQDAWNRRRTVTR